MHCTLFKCWQECLEKSNFIQKRKLAEKFNLENIWKKRGVAVIPLAYGVCFEVPWMNQGAALVQVNRIGEHFVPCP